MDDKLFGHLRRQSRIICFHGSDSFPELQGNWEPSVLFLGVDELKANTRALDL